MKALIPISLKRIAVKQMQLVESGLLDYNKAITCIQELTSDRSGIVAELTKSYDPDAVKAFRFFKLL